MDADTRYDELRTALSDGRLVVIVGAGLSMHATNASPCASWSGFLDESINYAQSSVTSADEAWAQIVKSTLEYARKNGDSGFLIRAAGMIRDKIAENGSQGLADWLGATIGALRPHDENWIKAIRDLKSPIFTTNYDTLIEDVTGLPSASWAAANDLHDIALGRKHGVGHLHGVWSSPDSIVLTEAEYIKAMGSSAPQSLQKALSTLKSILYVGVGGGLNDPNFGNLLNWHRSTFENSSVKHFRLCRSSELHDLEIEHGKDAIYPLVYGDDFPELPDFLQGLAPQESRTTSNDLILDVSSIAFEAIIEQVRVETIVGEVIGDIDTRVMEDLLVPPVVIPVPHEQFINSRALDVGVRPERSDPKDIAALDGVVVIVGEEHGGLTTSLRWLLAESARQKPGAVPLFVDFKQCQLAPRPIESQLRIQAAILGVIAGRRGALPAFVAAIDNMTPHAGRISDRAIADIATLQSGQIFLGCRLGEENDLLERLSAAGVAAEVRYVGRLAHSDVEKMARLVSPTRFTTIARSVVSLLRRQNLPRTPFTVSLLISILIKGDDISANTSHTSILDQYVSLLLGRGDPHDDARYSLDSVQREAILSDIAKLFVEARYGSMPVSSVTTRVQDFFDSLGWTESLTEVLKNFHDRRVLRTEGNFVRFSQDSYLYLFAAKAALDDDDFLQKLIDEPLLFAPILRHYAALKRTSRALIVEVEKVLDDWPTLTSDASPYRRLDAIEPPAGDEAEDESDAGLFSSEPESNEHSLEELDYDEDFAHRRARGEPGSQAPFPLTLDEQMPEGLRYSLALDLASTVLRDSDRVSDLTLKSQVLKKVLAGWGTLVGHLSGDELFHESFTQAAESVADGLGLVNEAREAYVREVSEILPPLLSLAGISSALSSRKLLKLLVDVTRDEVFSADIRGAAAAAMMIIDLREPGWPKHLATVLEQHRDTWIVNSFLGRLAFGAFLREDISMADEADARAFLADLRVRQFKWRTEIERKDYLSRQEQSLTKTKALDSRRRRGESAAPDDEYLKL